MADCFVCRNKTTEKQSICEGCLTLISVSEFDCEICGIELKTDNKICGNCQKASPAFSQVEYGCQYLAPASDWVLSLKFGKNTLVSKLMAEIMLPKLKQIDNDFVLTAVPLHKSRLRKRGYNQAYEIAIELAKLSERKLENCLLRTKKTEMQAQLKLNQRSKNIKGAFSVTKNSIPDKILLVDDVMTSGYTINECAKTLLKAGAKDVKVLVFARKSL